MCWAIVKHHKTDGSRSTVLHRSAQATGGLATGNRQKRHVPKTSLAKVEPGLQQVVAYRLERLSTACHPERFLFQVFALFLTGIHLNQD